jgi:hypothetical protein
MAPQNLQTSPSTFSGKDARLLQYQGVLADMSANSGVAGQPSQALAGEALQSTVDWLSEEDEEEDEDEEEEMRNFKVRKPETAGPLLGRFSDIEAGLR